MSAEMSFTAEQREELLRCPYEEVPVLAAQYHAAGNSWDVLGYFKKLWAEIPGFVNNDSGLHRVVCVDWNACTKIDSAGNIAAGLEAVIGPVVAKWAKRLTFFGARLIPVQTVIFFVALYITQLGIRSYCGCREGAATP